jgi:hypothetical protein
MSDEMRKAVCPQFHSALVEWYDVQGYCVPRRASDRPAIPDSARFMSNCTSSRFQECAWFTGARHFAGDTPMGTPLTERA